MAVGLFTEIQVMQDSLETGVQQDDGAVSHNNAAVCVIEGADPGVRWQLKTKTGRQLEKYTPWQSVSS